MKNVIVFPVSTSSEIEKIKNLTKVLNERLEDFDGSSGEANILLQEIHSLRSHLNLLEGQILEAKKVA